MDRDVPSVAVYICTINNKLDGRMLKQSVTDTSYFPHRFKVYSDSNSRGKILQAGSDCIILTVREVIVKKYPLKYG